MKDIRLLQRLAVIFTALLVLFIGLKIFQAVQKKNLDDDISGQSMELCELRELRSLKIVDAEGIETFFQFGDEGRIRSVTYGQTEFDVEKLNSERVNSYIQSIIGISVRKSFEPTESLSVYGLDRDQYTLTLSLGDGRTKTVHIGSPLSDRSGIYFQIDGDPKVYVANNSFYLNLSTKFESFLSQYITSIERSRVDTISFSRTSDGDKWKVQVLEDKDNGVFLESQYRVLEPIERDPRDEMIRMIDTILHFPANQYLPISEENRASYGLDAPEYQFDITLKTGETVKISLSRELGGYYYGECSSNPYTFRVLAGSIPGLDKPSFELIEAYVKKEYLDEFRSATVTMKDTTFTLECWFDTTGTFESEGTSFTLDKRNAKVIDSNGDCYGLVLFQSICRIPIYKMEKDADPDLSNVEATISVTRVDSENYTIKFVPKNENEYYCFLNDRYSGFIVERSVLYKDNGKTMSGYGIWDAYNLTNEAIDNKNAEGIYDRP